MPIEHPSFDDFVELVRAELRRQIPTIDPTVFGSWSRGFTDGVAAAASALDLVVRDVETQLFPQTAQGEFLNIWGDYEGLPRNAAAGAIGLISIPGVLGTVVSAGTIFTSATGFEYATSEISTVTDPDQGITGITRVGTTATATVAEGHALATGMEVTVSGADQAEYNITTTVSVLSSLTFSYEVSGSPTTPATGTIGYNAAFAVVDVAAILTGAQTNADAGALLTLTTPSEITDIDGDAYVQIDGLSGGSSIESDEDYRARILLSRSIIEGVFTEDQVILAALSLSGNTRAFVKRPTVGGAGGAEDPYPGQVAVYIMRDDDANPIPPTTVLDATKELIVADGAMPAHTAEADIFVEAPDPVSEVFDFNSLEPNTTTMQEAIRAQLTAFFQDSVQFETNVTENAYISAIQTTQDTQTGDFIESFALTTPSGPIVVTDGEIAVYDDTTTVFPT